MPIVSRRTTAASRDASNGSRAPRGQSFVEFALVLPMLLVLLLGIADFGRVFAAGITLEAAARDAAEAVAIERLRTKPATVGDPAYYQRLHDIAAAVACRETRSLPNTTFDETTSTCASMPVIAACVQDGADPLCGSLATAYSGTPPAQCDDLPAPWTSASGGTVGSHSVEVRLCYQFTTLLNLRIGMPFGWGINLGEVFLERARVFVVDCPPGDPSGC